MDRPPEVRDLELALNADEQVLRLDVAVDDVLLVAVHEGARQRRDVRRRAPLAKPLALLQLFIQLPLGGVLQDEVHAVLVVEIPVQPQYVGMAQVGLDLNLSPQLVLNMRLLQLILEQHLERDDVLTVLLARQVHVAELAAPQRLTYVEVAQLPALLPRRIGFAAGARGRRLAAHRRVAAGVLLVARDSRRPRPVRPEPRLLK
mmetsp:Transcript_37548/g.93369  ORF Transcript_37548/g.93369 Transcript_37548/m.93369 type:complete len:203 (-) Transcript_37548:257-865(-)